MSNGDGASLLFLQGACVHPCKVPTYAAVWGFKRTDGKTACPPFCNNSAAQMSMMVEMTALG